MTGCQHTQLPCGGPATSHGGAPPNLYPPPPKAQSPSPLPCDCHPAQPEHHVSLPCGCHPAQHVHHVCSEHSKHQHPSQPPPQKPQSHHPLTPLPCGCHPAQHSEHHVCPSPPKHQSHNQPPPQKPQSHHPLTPLPCGCHPAQHSEHHVCPSPPKHQSHNQPPPPKPQSHHPLSQLPCGCHPSQSEHHTCQLASQSQSYTETIISHSSSSSAQYSDYPPPSSATHPNPFTAVVPSQHVFTADTKRETIACFQFTADMERESISCFQSADRHGTGTVDDKQLQKSLSSYHHSFNRHTICLLIFIHTNSHVNKIGQTEFVQMYSSVMKWKATFEFYDRDHSGKIDISELGDALARLGYVVTPIVLKKLVSKYGKGEGNKKAIPYDYFIECCVTVKGLSDRFMERDTTLCGYVSFGYEWFMCTILPFMAS